MSDRELLAVAIVPLTFLLLLYMVFGWVVTLWAAIFILLAMLIAFKWVDPERCGKCSGCIRHADLSDQMQHLVVESNRNLTILSFVERASKTGKPSDKAVVDRVLQKNRQDMEAIRDLMKLIKSNRAPDEEVCERHPHRLEKLAENQSLQATARNGVQRDSKVNGTTDKKSL
jgi:hypothetical protein